MIKAIVHLTNGEVAHIELGGMKPGEWLLNVQINGINTDDSYFPYHSISYIIFENQELIENDKHSEAEMDKAN